MTKKNAHKVAARARQEAHGGKYENHLRNLGGVEEESVRTELEALLQLFGVTTTFTVVTGRTPSQAYSASLEVATKIANDERANPTWYAKTGTIESLVSEGQHKLLITSGAASDAEIQMVRTFRADRGTTFSVRCDNCHRWIWCGETERADTCVCGHHYRVAFDLANALHWTQTMGRRCMSCGAEWTLTEPRENRNPWYSASAWQTECNACFTKGDPMDREVSLYENGQLLGTSTYIPPGMPNGPSDPREGLLMAAPPEVATGRRYTIVSTGTKKRTEIIAGRTAGGGAFMVHFPS